MNKPREFWVTQDGFCTIPKRHAAYAEHPAHWDDLSLIHVIEKKAYDDALKMLEEMVSYVDCLKEGYYLKCNCGACKTLDKYSKWKGEK